MSQSAHQLIANPSSKASGCPGASEGRRERPADGRRELAVDTDRNASGCSGGNERVPTGVPIRGRRRTRGATPPAEASEGRLPTGSQIGEYELVSFIGRGATTEVYRAYQPRWKRSVAVKVVAADVSEPFLREIGLVRNLSHPNIVTVYDFDHRADGSAWMAMELVEGPSLAQLLESERPLAPRRAWRIAMGILSGLVEAHTQGIVHLDLKPSNILLTVKGPHHDWVKIVDFGTARVRMSGPDGAVQSGSSGYLAPEQVRSEATSPASDVFAVGLMLFEMLTGGQAPQPSSPGDRLEPALQLPEWLTTVPLGDIILRATAADPQNRFPSASELYAALQQAADQMVERQRASISEVLTAVAPVVADASEPSDPRNEDWFPTTEPEIRTAFELDDVLVPDKSAPPVPPALPLAALELPAPPSHTFAPNAPGDATMRRWLEATATEPRRRWVGIGVAVAVVVVALTTALWPDDEVPSGDADLAAETEVAPSEGSAPEASRAEAPPSPVAQRAARALTDGGAVASVYATALSDEALASDWTRVEVRTRPAPARVVANGTRVCASTPCAFRVRRAQEPLLVELERDRHRAKQVDVRRSRAVARVDAELEPLVAQRRRAKAATPRPAAAEAPAESESAELDALWVARTDPR